MRLSNELVELINEFGPKLYEDFNEVSGRAPAERVVLQYKVTLTGHACSVPDHGAVIERASIHRPARSMAPKEQHRGRGCARQSSRAPHGTPSMSTAFLIALHILTASRSLITDLAR